VKEEGERNHGLRFVGLRRSEGNDRYAKRPEGGVKIMSSGAPSMVEVVTDACGPQKDKALINGRLPLLL
jgi:hypothetical protein